MIEVRYLRLIVFFDLPTKTKKDKKSYTDFRKLLISCGFFMVQYSVYVRICKGQDSIETYERIISDNLPPRGSIRMLTVTNSQYERMRIFLGHKKNEEKIGEKQLLLF